MSEYYFPVPKRRIDTVLKRLIESGDIFEQDDAVMDLMYMMDTDSVLSQRDLATRWKWTRGQVRSRLPELKLRVGKWRNFGKKATTQAQPKHNPSTTQNTPKSSQKRTITTQAQPKHNPSTTHPDYIYPRATDTDTDTYKNNTRVTNVTPVVWNDRFDEVLNSWNEFADCNGLSKIKKLTATRKKWIRARYEAIMPEIECIYRNLSSSDYHMGRTEKFSGITFETLWRNKEHYLKYIEMETRQPGKNGKSKTATRSNQNGSQGDVYRPKSRTGRQVQGGVLGRGEAGSRRPGTLSRIEWLRNAGYTDEEIFGSHAEENDLRRLTAGPNGHA